MNEIHPLALFRLSVLGSLVSRERLHHGELQKTIGELAGREYAIPGSARRMLAQKTIQAWYYTWRKEGIAGLEPKVRFDRGQSNMAWRIRPGCRWVRQRPWMCWPMCIAPGVNPKRQ
jgi:hypothetical protein